MKILVIVGQLSKELIKRSYFVILLCMIKKIDIAGLQLDNYTVREMIMKIDRCMSERNFTTIEEINMDTLHMAASDEDVKEAIGVLDYTVIADTGILSAASAETMQRKHEIEDHDFFYELFKRLERNHKNIFILGESESTVSEAAGFLKELFDKIEIKGSGVINDTENVSEAIVNEINIASPDVVVSFLPSPAQETFLLHNKDKLSTNLWYGIGNNKFMDKKPGFIGKIRKMLDVKRLARIINNYENREE